MNRTKVVIESMHISDSGQTPNALGHENDTVEILDIFQYVSRSCIGPIQACKSSY